MKLKALGLALAVASVATSADAATVFKKDNFTWKLKGDIQVQLRQKAGADEDFAVDYDDAELKNSFSYKISDGLKAFAQVDYDFKKEQQEETYVGLGFGSTKVIIGDTDLPSDDFGNESQYEGSSFEDAFAETSSDDQLRVEMDFGGSSLAISTDVEDEEKASIDANFATSFSGVDFGLAYQSYEADADSESVDTVGVSFATKLGGAKLGLDYSENDNLEVLLLTGKFKVGGNTTLAAGYEMATEKGTDIDSWYINATKKLNKKVSLLAELHNTDEDDSDMGIVIGGRVKF